MLWYAASPRLEAIGAERRGVVGSTREFSFGCAGMPEVRSMLSRSARR